MLSRTALCLGDGNYIKLSLTFTRGMVMDGSIILSNDSIIYQVTKYVENDSKL